MKILKEFSLSTKYPELINIFRKQELGKGLFKNARLTKGIENYYQLAFIIDNKVEFDQESLVELEKKYDMNIIFGLTYQDIVDDNIELKWEDDKSKIKIEFTYDNKDYLSSLSLNDFIKNYFYYAEYSYKKSKLGYIKHELMIPFKNYNRDYIDNFIAITIDIYHSLLVPSFVSYSASAPAIF